MPTAKPATVRLREASASPMGGTADPREPVIRGVKVAGLVSKNGRRYSPACYPRARALLEGAVVNIDHPHRPGLGEPRQDRPAMSRFGRLTNVRTDDAGEPWADLRYNPEHPYAGAVRWWAAHDPAALGLSINATGRVRESADGPVVEDLLEVESVDLVADPATTKGLFESTGETMDDEIVTPEAPPVDAPVDEAPAGAGGYRQQVAQLVMSIVMDESLDCAAMLPRIKDALKVLSHDDAGHGDEEPAAEPVEEAAEDDEPAHEPGAVEESLKAENRTLKAELAGYRLRESRDRAAKTARELLAEAKLPATDEAVEALTEAADDDARKRLVTTFKKIAGVGQGKQPTSRGPSQGKPLSVEDFAFGAN